MDVATILIIDDEPLFCSLLRAILVGLGHEVLVAHNLSQGIQTARSTSVDLAIVDINLPDGNGLEALPLVKELPGNPEVIIITGSFPEGGATLAFASGAWDYLTKPFEKSRVELSVTRALQYHSEKSAARTPILLERKEIVGSSQFLVNQLALVAQAAMSKASVLITGETGVGKELFARAIHTNSRAAQKNFVVVDCAALPETLVESMLFGHVKGAFTGADRPNEGLIRQADEGTLFLDEIGELPLNVQSSFLRVLQDQTFRPVGGTHEIKSHFRLVAATNRDLETMVRGGTFRRDLLYRISSFTITVPPLRDRKDDIRELIVYFLDRLCGEYGVGVKGFVPEFLEYLMHYTWPGNVRELFSTLERALAAAGSDPTLYPMHLPSKIRVFSTSPTPQVSLKPVEPTVEPVSEPPSVLPPLKDYRETVVVEAEKQYLSRLLALTRGDIREACRVSNLSEPRMYALLKKHNLSRRTFT